MHFVYFSPYLMHKQMLTESTVNGSGQNERPDLSTSVHWLIYQGRSNNRIYSSPYILTVLLYQECLMCMVFLVFYCCGKHPDGEQPGVERAYFILNLSGQMHHVGRNLGSN